MSLGTIASGLVLILILCVFLILIMFILLYFFAMIITEAKNQIPLLNTRSILLAEVFELLHLEKKSKVIDLGCGDGSVLRYVANKYQSQCVGYENNPLLIWWNQLLVKVFRLKNMHFVKRDIFTLTKELEANVIYIFLLPKLVDKLAPLLLRYCKVGTLIVSHGFAITALESRLIHSIKHKPFGFFVYRI